MIKKIVQRIIKWIMANYEALKTAIRNAVYENGNNEITGQGLQDVLEAIVNSLGSGFQFASVATTETEPGTPDSNVMYIAGAGTYPNFGGTVVPRGSLGVFRYNGEWIYSVVDIASWADASNKLYYNTQAGNVAAKTIQADGFTLQPGGWLKVHFNNANTVDNPTLNVNNTGAHAMTFNGNLVSATNSWKTGETIAFYYDNYGVGLWRGIRLIDLPDFLNVNDLISQETPFASASAARTVIPQQNRKAGLNITYLLTTGENTSQWVQDMFIGDDVTDWSVADNWKVIGPVSVSQNSETGKTELHIGNNPVLIVDNEPKARSNNLIKSGSVALLSLMPDTPQDCYNVEFGKGYTSPTTIVDHSDFAIATILLTGREKYISALNKVSLQGTDYRLAPLFVFYDANDEVIGSYDGQTANIGKMLCTAIPDLCVKVGVNIGIPNIASNKIRFYANDDELLAKIHQNELDIATIKDEIFLMDDFAVNILNPDILTSDYYANSYYMTPYNLAKLIYDNPGKQIYINEIQYIPPTGVTTLSVCSIDIDSNGVLQQRAVEEIINLTPEMLINGVYHVPFNRFVDYIPGVYRLKYKNNLEIEHQGYVATGQNINDSTITGLKGELSLGASGYIKSNRFENIEFSLNNLENEVQSLNPKVESLELPLKGKIINFLGDSITYQATYINAMITKQGITANNYGISGTCISSEFSDSFVSRYANMTDDCDIVVVFGGINDWNKGGVLGTFENTNGNTFYSSLHALISGLKDKYINGAIKKPVFVCTPLHSQFTLAGYSDKLEYTITDGIISANSYGNGATLKEYVDAIRKVCEYYGVPVIDLYSLSNLAPIQANNKSKYFQDGLHPNSAGGNLIANCIIEKITEYLKNW